jgi:hypothetical protein
VDQKHFLASSPCSSLQKKQGTTRIGRISVAHSGKEIIITSTPTQRAEFSDKRAESSDKKICLTGSERFWLLGLLLPIALLLFSSKEVQPWKRRGR